MSKKIQLALDEEAVSTLELLLQQTGAQSMAEVLRDALGVYSSLRDLLAGNAGCELALIDRRAGEFQALTIPSFQRSHVVLGVKGPTPTEGSAK